MSDQTNEFDLSAFTAPDQRFGRIEIDAGETKHPVIIVPGHGVLLRDESINKLLPLIGMGTRICSIAVFEQLAAAELIASKDEKELRKSLGSMEEPKQYLKQPEPAPVLDSEAASDAVLAEHAKKAQAVDVDEEPEPEGDKLDMAKLILDAQEGKDDEEELDSIEEEDPADVVEWLCWCGKEVKGEEKCPRCGFNLPTEEWPRMMALAYDEDIKGPDPDKMEYFLHPSGFKLAKEQKDALARVLKGQERVTIVTGLAGAGKSAFIDCLRDCYGVAVCASTGKAAMNVGGCTGDTLFSMDRDGFKVRNSNSQRMNMRACGPIIVWDEASMIGNGMGDFVYDALMAHNKRIILVGDFAQAEPVKDGCILKSYLLLNGYDFIKFVECHRQSEGPYLSSLNKVRVGEIDDKVEAVFSDRVCKEPPDNDEYIRMYATNAMTKSYNAQRLNDLCEKTGDQRFTLYTKFRDTRDQALKDKWPRDKRFIEREIENTRFAHGDDFALGARVVFVANDVSDSRSFVNGDTGAIIDAVGEDGNTISVNNPFDPPKVGRITVLMDRTGARLTIFPMNREAKNVRDRDKTDHVITGFPLRLGYALTIHKSQGMTVDSAWVDMRSILRFPKGNRNGLAYVALSRTRTIDGLLISEWVPEAIECNQELQGLF